jgi:cyclophilin family peptidyl-prolyl cis-trans isomerase
MDKYSNPPKMQIDPSKSYTANIKTDVGEIKIALFADKAPKTVNNFVFLAKEGFYDNVIFHRVIHNFMAQAGDPTGTGRGGPGYRFDDEFHPDLRHDKPGILSMANAGPITYVPTPHLNDRHSVFGEVIEGMDVLLSIPDRDPTNVSAPAVKIHTIEITEA